MKITFIGQKGIPALAGGVERHVEELALRLVKQPDTEVVAYTRPWYTSKALQSHQGVRLISLPTLYSKHLDAISHSLFSIIHAAFVERADIIHIHAVGPALLTPIARLLRPKAKVVVTFHCLDRQHQKWGRLAKFMLWLGEWTTMRFAHEVIAVSTTLKHYSYEAYGRVVRYIPNGASLNQPLPASIIEQQFGLKKDGYILMVSRLVRHKGAHHLIRAYQQMDSAILGDKKLVIVGDSAFTDQYVEEVKQLAANDDRIIFTGLQTGKALQELFSNAYCFVLPSESEGLPIVLLEAGSYGKALVASDIPANREVVEDHGILVPVGDVDELRQALEQIVASPELATELGALARNLVMEYYLWDNVAADTHQLYQELLQWYTHNRERDHEKQLATIR
jgi:glycosyltransferase involved in cell wall biosynthesis